MSFLLSVSSIRIMFSLTFTLLVIDTVHSFTPYNRYSCFTKHAALINSNTSCANTCTSNTRSSPTAAATHIINTCYKFSQVTTLLSAHTNVGRLIASFDSGDFALPSGSWPYKPNDFNRLDNSNDGNFYEEPRFVTHIDDRAIESLTAYYLNEFEDYSKNIVDGRPLDVLDLCSSWISHFPDEDCHGFRFGRVVGIGMNEEELKANKALTEYYQQDLNAGLDSGIESDSTSHPLLSQFEDESFDFVCNVVSVDYLTNPYAVFQETHRVLRKGGRALISFSNRCFPTKAIAMWLQADDIDRLTIVGSYFHYSAVWASIDALDIGLPPLKVPDRPKFDAIMKDPTKAFSWAAAASAVSKANNGDPMYLVKAVKK